MPHQLDGAASGRGGKIGNASFGQPAFLCGGDKQIERPLHAAHGARMQREDDGVAGLDGEQSLVDGSGDRTGGGTQGNNDPEGNPHFKHVAPCVFPERAHAAHAAQSAQHGTADKADLVLPAAVIGFLKGHHGKLAGMFLHFSGHMLDDLIKLLLGEARQFFLCLPRVFREDSGVLHGKQVFVGNHRSRPVFRRRVRRTPDQARRFSMA